MGCCFFSIFSLRTLQVDTQNMWRHYSLKNQEGSIKNKLKKSGEMRQGYGTRYIHLFTHIPKGIKKILFVKHMLCNIINCAQIEVEFIIKNEWHSRRLILTDILHTFYIIYPYTPNTIYLADTYWKSYRTLKRKWSFHLFHIFQYPKVFSFHISHTIPNNLSLLNTIALYYNSLIFFMTIFPFYKTVLDFQSNLVQNMGLWAIKIVKFVQFLLFFLQYTTDIHLDDHLLYI